MKYKLSELYDRNSMLKVFDAFTKMAGIPAAIIDLQAEVLVTTPWQKICTDFHRVNPVTREKCIESDTYLANQLNRKEFSIYTCRNGLTDCAAPIVLEDDHVANFFVGQFFLKPADEEFFRAQAAVYGFDEEAYMEAVRKVPVVQEERLGPILDFLVSFAQMLGLVGLDRMRQWEAVQALREQVERSELAIKGADLGMWDWDLLHGGLVVNPRSAAMLGYAPDELKPKFSHWLRLVHPEDVPFLNEAREKHMAGSIPSFGGELRMKAKSGEWKWIITRGKVMERDAEDKPIRIVGTFLDITERKEAERALKAAHDDLEVRVEQRTLEFQQTLDDLKRAQAQIIESEKMAALGQLIAGVAHEINSPLGAITSSVGNIISTLNQTLERLPSFFHQLTQADRELFLTALQRSLTRASPLSAKEERTCRRALAAKLADRNIRWGDELASTVVMMGIHEDIDELLPLFRTDSGLSVLSMAYKLSGLQRSASIITTAAERAAKVVFALKNYARFDSSGEMVKANLVEGIETVLTLYHNQLKHGVEVRRNLSEVPHIPCYPDELNQVWTNLVHNALQAMDHKGILTISLDCTDGNVVARFSDTGRGIPKELKERIFDPFFTTKPAGEGSGLGLHIVRRIIDKHEGQIRVDSEIAKGTTITVAIPIR